ncbi:hypothetical protein CFC21_027737 [Triticum aestivum]|uniref:L-lactate dehydrogenase n=2 Tax=Triticum aestivum TaxID=4565 RepID=A0A3B6D9F6_WHEAT|nr:L-lactate dehydrogenase B-like [Triticum aestivum]KAF7013669.1 hypothetical protein CFC21_027737 [Triticum aestivum]
MMHKTSSLSELGFDAGDASSGFFRAVADGCPLTPTSSSAPHRRLTKVSVIGAGNVGMAIAQTILTQNLADEIAIVDALPDKLRGEALDLQHAAAFLPRVRIVSGTDASVTRNSDLVVVTAGARQIPGETRLNLLQRNVALYRKIVPPVAEHSPDALLLVVSNPVDVLTYVTWKLSGFPASRVIGSGTNLDSSRFRFLVAEHLDVSAQDVQAYMVGEHGDSSVAIWSSISVGGMPALKSLRDSHRSFDEAALEGIRRAVVGGAYEVIGLKGYTSWAIGYSVASLAASLLRDQRRVHPVSVLAAGFHGISDGHEVFLSLPARLGRAGVLGVAEMDLTEAEAAQLRRSAKTLWENCQLLGL